MQGYKIEFYKTCWSLVHFQEGLGFQKGVVK